MTSHHYSAHIHRGLAVAMRAALVTIAVFLVTTLVGVGLPAVAAPTAQPSAQANELWQQVKARYATITYHDIVRQSNPRLRVTEQYLVRNELKTENGGANPSPEQVEERHLQWYADRLNLQASFNSNQRQLDTLMPQVIDQAMTFGDLTAQKLHDNAAKILLGLAYMKHYYAFTIGHDSAWDRILANSSHSVLDAVLIRLATMGNDFIRTYDHLMGAKTASTYATILSPITGHAQVTDHIAALLRTHTPDSTPNEWLKNTTQAVIVETGNITLWDKFTEHADLREHLLPLLAITGPHIYVANNPYTMQYGLTSTYGGKTPELITKIHDTLNGQIRFWEFWQRMSPTVDRRSEKAHVVVYDTLQREPGSAQLARDRWSTQQGGQADPGVREFITPINKYRTYLQTSAEAAGTDIRFFIDKAIERRGLNTYSHELTHIFDTSIWFNGYGRRAGVGPETYAQGLYETEDNTPPHSSYQPYFNINTAYELGDDRIQNKSATRFDTPADVQQYMRGLMDVVYSLDAMEALSALKLSNDDKAVAFNKITQVDDANPSNAPKLDRFTHVTPQDVASITTLDQVVDAGLVSGRLIAKGNNPATIIPRNEYVSVSLFEPVYAGQQVNESTVGGFSFRRYAHELLAEYGWEKGFIGYLSDQYANDGEALAAIMPEHQGNMATFKKAMFDRRVKKFDDMLPAAGYLTAADMQAAMDQALAQDIERIKANPLAYRGQLLAGDGTAVRDLKMRIFKDYLLATDDFRTSIYSKRTGTHELTATVTLLDEARNAHVPPAGRGFTARVAPAASNDTTGYAGLATSDVAFASDTANLGRLTFTKAGQYTFTITQVPGDDKKINYDDATYTIVLTVAPDATNPQRYAVASQIKKANEAATTVQFDNILKQPVVTERETRQTQEIPITEEIILDNTVLAGTPDQEIRPGKPGVRTIVYVQRFIDGEADGEPTVKSDTETTPMETRQIRRGTKAMSVAPATKTVASYALPADKLRVQLTAGEKVLPWDQAGKVAFTFTQVSVPDGGELTGLPTEPVAPADNGQVNGLSALKLKGEGRFVIGITQVPADRQDVAYDSTARTLTLVTGWETDAKTGARSLVVTSATLTQGQDTVDAFVVTNTKKPVEVRRTTDTVNIAVEEEIVLDNTVLAGTPDEVIREGEPGMMEIVKVQSFIDGEPVSEQTVESTTVTKEMVTRQIRRGTKAMSLAPATVNEAAWALPADKFTVKVTKEGAVQPLTEAGDVRVLLRAVEVPEGGHIGGLPTDPVAPDAEGRIHALEALTFSGEGTFVIEATQVPSGVDNVVFDRTPRKLTVVTGWESDPSSGARRLVVKSVVLAKGSETVTELVFDNVLSLPEVKIEECASVTTEQIPVAVEYVDDPELTVGTQKVLRVGTPGEKTVTIVRLCFDDVPQGEPKSVIEEVTTAMVTTQIARGTKPVEEPQQSEAPVVPEKPGQPQQDDPEPERPSQPKDTDSVSQSGQGQRSGQGGNGADDAPIKGGSNLADTGSELMPVVALAGLALGLGLLTRNRRR